MKPLLLLPALLALAGCTGASSTTVQSTSATTGITSEPPNTTGGDGTTGIGSIYGEASVHSDDGFGFSPTTAQVYDYRYRTTFQQVVVTLSEDSVLCRGAHSLRTVRLWFGQDGVPLVAGSYEVSDGARIVWDESDDAPPIEAQSGLINCNSIFEGKVAGSFIAQLPAGDGGTSELSGIFTAESCDP